jgi:hypothetical protein
MPPRRTSRGPTRGSVLDVISRLSETDLVQALFDITQALYQEDGVWDPNREWTSNEVDEVARALPREVHDAVRSASRLPEVRRRTAKYPNLTVFDENGLQATPTETAHVISELFRFEPIPSGFFIVNGSRPTSPEIHHPNEVDWSEYDGPLRRAF